MQKKLYISSSHASLEFDHARMFTDLGYQVFGNFDIGSNQRRKLVGITDRNSDINDDYDVIILHQVADYVKVMEELLRKDKTVILVSFGQTDIWQYEALADLCRNYKKAYIAAYSNKDYKFHLRYLCPQDKIRLIRFGKYLMDFEPWLGTEPQIYLSCNSFHKRGNGCGYHLFEKIRKKLNCVISGRETEEIGGLGEITEKKMRELYKTSAGFLSFGTVPACYVLTQIEAWCAGCPTVLYNNKYGIENEGLELLLEDDLEMLVEHCKRLTIDPIFRGRWHIKSMENRQRFDVKIVGPMWNDFIKEVLETK